MCVQGQPHGGREGGFRHKAGLGLTPLGALEHGGHAEPGPPGGRDEAHRQRAAAMSTARCFLPVLQQTDGP